MKHWILLGTLLVSLAAYGQTGSTPRQESSSPSSQSVGSQSAGKAAHHHGKKHHKKHHQKHGQA